MCKYSEKCKQLSGVVQLRADSRKRDEVVRRQGLSRLLSHHEGLEFQHGYSRQYWLMVWEVVVSVDLC